MKEIKGTSNHLITPLGNVFYPIKFSGQSGYKNTKAEEIHCK